MPNNKQKGQKAEEQAKKYLTHKGYTFITQNFHAQGGEIDLIFKDKDEFVFVEVKYRKNETFGDALTAITPQKIQKMLKAIEKFFEKEENMPYFRLEAIVVTPKGITHLQNIGDF